MDNTLHSIRLLSIVVLMAVVAQQTGFTQVKSLKKYSKSSINFRACNIPPVITCPSDFVACPGVSTAPGNTGFATGIPGGPGCSPPIITHSDMIISQGPCQGTVDISRVWTATDPQDPNLTSSCLQKIILKDEVPPVISNCPLDTTVQANANCNATVFWNSPNVTDNCGKLFLSVSHLSGDIFPIGITKVTYTAEDQCGNTSSCSFNINVQGSCCDAPPVITCTDYNGCPNDGIDPSKTGYPVAVAGSPLCNVPVIRYRDSILSSGTCAGSISLIRFWTALDPIDTTQQATCTQLINLKDVSGPTITLCPVDITVSAGFNCQTRVNWNHPIIHDDCSGGTLVSNIQPNTYFNVGSTTINYTATDVCGNTATCSFTITVSDCCNEMPKLSCPAAYAGCPGSSLDPSVTGIPVAEPGTPNCQQPIVTYQDLPGKTGPCAGELRILRIWTAKDPLDSLLKRSCVQVIDLLDTLDPEFISSPFDIHIPVDSNCMATATWQEPVAKDNCTATTLSASHTSGSRFPLGTTVVNYSATDLCGNTKTISFKVVVTGSCCNKPPVITCPQDYSGCPQADCQPGVSGTATAVPSSPSCGTPVITYRDELIKNYSCLHAKKFKRIWRATDPNDSTLFSECTQIIDLNDITPPVFTYCPSDITVDAKGACEKEVWWNLPTATDNCGIKQITSNYKPGNTFPAGTTTVVYTAMDQCGNITNHSFKVTVIGNGFKIHCPNNIVVDKDPNLNGAYVNWNHPTVTTCKPCSDSLPGFMYMGTYLGNKYFCSLNTATWPTAKAICESAGGKLCVFNSLDENIWLASKLMGVTAYIGLHDSNVEGRFDWIDGTPFTFSNWANGQPNNANGDQDYVELLPDGTWNDQYTTSKREFICKIPCYTLTQIAGPPCGSFFPCGTTKVTYVAKQGNLTDTCSFTVTVKCNGGNNYCISKGLDCSPMWIQCVKLANVDNCSGPNGGYKYFNNPCIEVTTGNTYQLCLTPGFSGSTYLVYWKVWIDFNGDGDFEDAGELFAYGNGTTKICGYVTIPGCAPVTTRMRVAMSYGGYPPNPCCTFPYGEVEDYCIDIHNTFDNNGENALQNDPKLKFKLYSGVDLTLPDQNPEPEDYDEISIQDNNELIIYPNPASDKIQIGLRKGDILKIRVFDMRGKQVYFETYDHPKSLSELTIMDWREGIYLIQLEGGDGYIRSGKFERMR